MITILVDASREIISERLYGRGRENAAKTKERIRRTSEISADLKNCIKLKNDGAIINAGEELVSIIYLTKQIIS